MANNLEHVIAMRQREAEEYFAGSVFLNPARSRQDCAWLQPELIHDDRIRAYWKGILNGLDSNEAALEAKVLTDILGWISAGEFVNLLDSRPFARKIADESWLAGLASALPELARSIGEGSIAQARELSQKIAADVPTGNDNISTSTNVGYEFSASLDDDRATINTFIPKIDAAVGGLWRQTEAVLCSRPSVGKTALAWQVARDIAISGARVLFVSLEMGSLNLWARAACGAARIPYRDVRAKRITAALREEIILKNDEIIAALDDRLYIDDRTRQTTTDLWRKVASLRPDVLVCDHIRLFADPGDRETKRLGTITWNLKQIAKEYNTAVLALAQLNRDLEKREDKHPTLSDLRDSGEIEENADFVLGLHRDRQYLEHQMERTPADLVVLKFRDGPADIKIKLTFDGLGQRFDDQTEPNAQRTNGRQI